MKILYILTHRLLATDRFVEVRRSFADSGEILREYPNEVVISDRQASEIGR